MVIVCKYREIKSTFMSIFNCLHTTIKAHCIVENKPYCDCYDAILSEIEIENRANLDFYLSFLEDLGLITYNSDNKEIAITTLGKSTQRVFS